MAARSSISIADAVPTGWLSHLTASGRLDAGLDLATTENKKSNPSSLAIVELVGLTYFVRLLARWKTSDPAVTLGIVRHVIALLAVRQRKLRRLCVDATSERFFSADLRKALVGSVPVELVVSSESIVYMGQTMTTKAYLGNLYVNAIEDGRLALPDDRWVADDALLVTRDKGSFAAAVDEHGNHADSFDSTKLGIHAHASKGGPAVAQALAVGSGIGAGEAAPHGQHGPWKNPYSHLYNGHAPTLNV